MKLESLLAATIWLAVPLSQTVTAQDEKSTGGGGATSRASTVEALREVQKALHAAESAQLQLLASGRDAKVLAEVHRAVKSLTAAREALRSRLSRQTPGGVLIRADKWTERNAVGKIVDKASRKPAPKVDLPKLDRNKVKLAVEKGLKWLKEHQDDDGKWDSDGFMKHDKQGVPCDGAGNPVHDVGVTGLALLAFLGSGSTTRSGPHKEAVSNAVGFLQKQQGENGLFGTAASHDFIYDHAIATFAMCEAYALSKDKRLRRAAQRGINYLESHRNPYACWRYQPRDNDNDMSVTRWCVMAYKSAQDGGLQVNKQALKIAANFVDELTDPRTGSTGYTKRGERSSRHPGDHATRFPVEKGEALTAAGLSTRFVLGQRPARNEVMKVSANRLLSRAPTAKTKGAIDHYYWYHGTSAMQQMGGSYWDKWSRAVGAAMLSTQRHEGNFDGSWDSSGPWGEDGGRVYSTSLLVMAMQVAARDAKVRNR